MTASRGTSTATLCFLSLLLWLICTTVGDLVNKEPQPTIAGQALTKANNESDHISSGNSTSTDGCGDGSSHCDEVCQICSESYLAPMDCLEFMYQPVCLKSFYTYMDSQSDRCLWSNVRRYDHAIYPIGNTTWAFEVTIFSANRSAYNNVTICTETLAECLQIPWPNPLVEKTFVNIHAKFFKDCPSEELSDPPPGIVFALVMTPICLIPVMVVLVVLKTKNGDGSS